ncbi:hypothetical protein CAUPRSCDRAFT_10450 [Caulochytrium protostelioides]|uniref:Uncharacterized protein n=1 Tax=Caulochytrium protostelioides TaxID=1555241 RepID=A0A4P9WWV1_9FUNG|nr:hypothetical protein CAUPRSCDRAFT_10450 [Caulochytrium protostelioides]
MAADDALVHATCGLLCELLRAGDVGALSMALTPIHGAWSAWIVARTLRQVCCALVHELPTASVMAARLQPFVDVVDRIGQCSSTAAASATVSACAMRQAFLDADVMDALAASLPANDGRWLPPHADRSDGPAAATSGDAGLAGDPVLLLHGCLAMRQALRHASAGTHATEAADALTAAERLRDSQTIARCVARGRCGALHALLGAAALPDPVLVAQITGPPTTASLALRFDPRSSPSASPGSGVRSWAQAAHPRCAAARACARVLTLHGYRAPAGQPFRRAWQSAWCSRCADADIEEEDEPAKAEGRRAAVPADRVG